MRCRDHHKPSRHRLQDHETKPVEEGWEHEDVVLRHDFQNPLMRYRAQPGVLPERGCESRTVDAGFRTNQGKGRDASQNSHGGKQVRYAF